MPPPTQCSAMKCLFNIPVFVLAFVMVRTCLSQGFVNLDFDEAVITPGVPGVSTATLTGWAVSPLAYPVANLNVVLYNVIAFDAAAVTLQGANSPYSPAIQGLYSILLQGGSMAIPESAGGASISQTGQIPLEMESLIILANTDSYSGSTFQVTFAGQELPFLMTGSTATYDIYSADVSAYAGQTGLLQFSVPWQSNVLFDNYYFSSSPVPEPKVSALAIFGALLLAWRHRGKSHDVWK